MIAGPYAAREHTPVPKRTFCEMVAEMDAKWEKNSKLRAMRGQIMKEAGWKVIDTTDIAKAHINKGAKAAKKALRHCSLEWQETAHCLQTTDESVIAKVTDDIGVERLATPKGQQQLAGATRFMDAVKEVVKTYWISHAVDVAQDRSRILSIGAGADVSIENVNYWVQQAFSELRKSAIGANSAESLGIAWVANAAAFEKMAPKLHAQFNVKGTDAVEECKTGVDVVLRLIRDELERTVWKE